MGLACILAPVFLYPRDIPYPGVYALPPTLGTALVIRYASPGGLAHRLLSVKSIVGLGLISYSAYLWHQPLFAFARHRLLSEPRPAIMLLLIAASLALAFLTWRYLEAPSRDGRRLSRVSVAYASVAGVVVLLTFGVVGELSRGFPERVSAQASISRLPIDNQSCREPDDLPNFELCEFGDLRSSTEVLLFGDSHAGAIKGELHRAFKRASIKGVKIEIRGCPAIASIYESTQQQDPEQCERRFGMLYDYLSKTDAPIIVLNRWTFRIYPVPGAVDQLVFENSNGGREYEAPRTFSVKSSTHRSAGEERDKEWALSSFIEGLLRSPKLLLVYPVSEVGWDMRRLNNYASLVDGKIPDTVSVSEADYRKRNRFIIKLFDKFKTHANLIAVRPEAVFCDTYVAGRCVAQLHGTPLYEDDDHLSDAGAKMLVDQIMKKLDIEKTKSNFNQ